MCCRCCRWTVVVLVAVVIGPDAAWGQAVMPLPYSAQLKTDPAVGNVQGIQRYGRPLKTDPDQGEGYSYHVYPVAYPETTVVQAGGQAGELLPTPAPMGGGVQFRAGEITNAQGESLAQLVRERDELQRRINAGELANEDLASAQQRLADLAPRISELTTQAVLQGGLKSGGSINVLQAGMLGAGPGYGGYGYGDFGYGPPGSPFDWTHGIRNFAGPAPGTPFDGLPREVRAAVVSRTGLTLAQAEIYHQPLVQIKMRVVEVARSDGLTVGSILEYVANDDKPNSLTSGNTANRVGNQGRENFRSLTRFLVPDLVTNASNGTGSLINLTTEHINWLVQALATEMNADVVTAPELVTLNGQNVEFVAGEKLPFELGQNVIQGTNNNIQQVFYKHVGTMVSVTPRIVNWGFHGEGEGEAVVVASDVHDWQGLVKGMFDSKLKFQIPGSNDDIGPLLRANQDQPILPYSVKSKILLALNTYSKRDLRLLSQLAALNVISEEACTRCYQWKPEDCTIDLSVVVRLSEGAKVGGKSDDPDLTNITTAERNVRAVANVIQVKSGHGVVMAGLIGERELDDLAKVPLLGDIPLVGFLFRSKSVTRVKTEVLIFIEAQVLDPDPHVARSESAGDYDLGRAYVEGELLENPLETGMYLVGFGNYLPPHTHSERVFWERFHRKIRKVHTHVGDLVRP